ncbi:MAG: fluoride efflux transporter CrcB [Saprospiraceae bacterium]|nr:fluoride efflux transporter CrcB [Saprospiraceae bacterium]
MNPFLLVFLGGGLGSVCRYALGLLLQPHTARFPWATLAANGLACLILGVLTGLSLQGKLSDQQRLLFATGFCGGFSTFSTFTNETWGLWQNGQPEEALLNVTLSLAVCFLCLLLGIKIST